MRNVRVSRHVNQSTFYDKLPCGVVSFTPEGQIVSLNTIMAKWLGVGKEEVYQQNFKSLLSKSSMLYYSMVVDPMLNLKSSVSEINLQFDTKGDRVDTLFNAVTYRDDKGSITMITATIQKITDRKKYEKELLFEKRRAEQDKRRFEFLFNSVPNHVWTTDAEGLIITVNKKARDYFGIGFFDNPQDYLHILKQDKGLYEEWMGCLITGNKFHGELRMTGIDEVEEWFLLTAEPYYNSDGLIEMWFCSTTNIHKQKTLQLANQDELQLSLAMANKTLDANAKLFMRIAMNQSHMIRKPLANIMGLADLLKEENSKEESTAILALLLESAEELDQMIKKLNEVGLDDSSDLNEG